LFQQISIGEHCWIGAGSIVMADIGARATAGPGSVVAQQVPADSTVSGNPARNFSVVLKSSSKAGT
jgi:maltose O-acetyltransferase